MPQPALGREAEIKEDGRDDGAGDEQGFQPEGTNVGDVGYSLTLVHGWEVRRALDQPDYEHGEEECCSGFQESVMRINAISGVKAGLDVPSHMPALTRGSSHTTEYFKVSGMAMVIYCRGECNPDAPEGCFWGL